MTCLFSLMGRNVFILLVALLVILLVALLVILLVILLVLPPVLVESEDFSITEK